MNRNSPHTSPRALMPRTRPEPTAAGSTSSGPLTRVRLPSEFDATCQVTGLKFAEPTMVATPSISLLVRSQASPGPPGNCRKPVTSPFATHHARGVSLP